VADFTPGEGGDVLDYADLLLRATQGYEGQNPFAAGYLRFQQQDQRVLVSFDPDGGIGSVGKASVIAVLAGINSSDLVASNFQPAFDFGVIPEVRSVSFSKAVFTEAAINDGSIDDTVTIVLSKDKFTGQIGGPLPGTTIANIPQGLGAEIIKIDESTASMRFFGRAVKHSNIDDVRNISVVLDDSSFQSGPAADVLGAQTEGISIDFNNPAPTFPSQLGNGWVLVARMADESHSGGMFDGLGDLRSDYYFGVFSGDPGSSDDFFRPFPFKADQILFITGDGQYWGRTNYDALQRILSNPASFEPNLDWQVSVDGSTERLAKGNVLFRGSSNPEDPWISLEGNHNDGFSKGLLIWGEADSTGYFGVHTNLKNSHGGVNIYIKGSSNSTPVGIVSINGVAVQGETLTVTNDLSDAEGLGAISYIWKAAGATVGTGTNYTLTQAEVGKTVTVTASYADGGNTAESVTSAATAAVANVNDTPTGSVTISGTATQGQTLTAANTLADPDGLGSITYTWKAGGSTVGTGSSYALTQAEVGKTITVTASYTDGGNTAESVTSAASMAVANVNDAPTGTVTISGVPMQGQVLTASNTLADADGLGAIAYTWKADGVHVGTGQTYTLTQSEVGKTITVTASYVDGWNTSESFSSEPSGTVMPLSTSESNWDQIREIIRFRGNSGELSDTAHQVIALSAGGFLVAWQGGTSDNKGSDIFLSRFSEFGLQIGNTLRFQGYLDASDDKTPELVEVASGKIALSWWGATDNTPWERIFLKYIDVTGVEMLEKQSIEVGGIDGTEVILRPQISSSLNDQFVLTWWGDIAGQDPGVYIEAYDAEGNFESVVRDVLHGTTPGEFRDRNANVSMAADGGFVVSWWGAVNSSQTAYDLFVQRFDASGKQIGLKSQIPGVSRVPFDYPQVTHMTDGKFFVVWSANMNDGMGDEIFAQIFNEDGTKSGGVIQLHGMTGDLSDRAPSVVALRDGGFAAAWTGATADGQDTDIFVYISPESQGLGQSNSTLARLSATPGNFSDDGPTLTSLSNGGVAVAWSGRTPDRSGADIFIRRFSIDGSPEGSAVKLTDAVDGSSHFSPSLSKLGNGSVAVVWEGLSYDGNGQDLFAKVLSFEPAGSNLQGLAYHWKSHALLDKVGVQITDQTAVAETPKDLFDLRAASFDAAVEQLTVEVWANPTAIAESLDFTATGPASATLSFTSALGADWTALSNTQQPGQLALGAYLSNLSATGLEVPTRIGTLQVQVAPGTTDLQIGFSDIQVGDSAISDLALTLAGAVTGADGAFQVQTLPAGNYGLSASRVANDGSNGVTSADALAALRLAVGINPNTDPDGPEGPLQPLKVSPYQFMAADANQDGKVTSADALAVLKMAVKLSTAVPQEWFFVEETRDLWNETTGQSALTRTNAAWSRVIDAQAPGEVNLVGVLKGDVNGSWSAPAGAQDLDVLQPGYFDDLSQRIGAPLDQFGVYSG
jgi:hypothetical protein